MFGQIDLFKMFSIKRLDNTMIFLLAQVIDFK
jgi:hypothetical protein